MTLPTSDDKTPSLVSFPSRSQRSSGVFIGVILTCAAIILTLIAPLFDLEVNDTLAGLLCFVLYVFSSLWDEHAEDSTWSAYRHLAILVAWQINGLGPTLLLVLTGISIAAAIRLQFGKSGHFWDHPPAETFRSARDSLFLQAVLLLTAELIFRIMGSTAPRISVLPVLVVIIVALAASHIVEYLLTATPKTWPPAPMDVHQRYRLFTEIALLPLIIILPLIFRGSGLSIFAVIILMVAAYAQRYHQTTAAARESAQLYNQSAALMRKLALVNRMAQNAMFNVDQPIAMKTACQTAATIIQADYAAIFLIQPEQNRIQLAESMGFSGEQLAAGYNLPYKPPLPSLDNTYAIADTQITPDTSLAAAFHRALGVRALALVPLRSGNLELGYLAVYHNQPHMHKPMELELLEILGGQLAASLDNIQLLQALELHAFELSHLVYLSRVATSSPQIDKVSAELADVLRQITAMDWATLALREEQNGRMPILGISGNGKPVSSTPGSFVPAMPEIDQMDGNLSSQIHSFHIGQSDISDALHSFMESYGLVSLVLAPLIANNQLMGLILLGAVRLHRLSAREEQMLETATNQLANQLANLQLYQRTNTELHQQLEQLALIEDIVQRISSSHDFNTIIDDVFEAAIKSTRADMVDLALLTEAEDFWVIERYYEDGKPIKRVFSQRKDEGIIGKVQRTGEIILTPDNSAVSDYVPTEDANYRSSLSVPLTKDGDTVGVLNVESKKGDFFNRSQADFLKNLGGHAIISIDNARLLEELQHQINTLTSLRELSLEIATATDTDSVAKAVLKTAMRLTRGQYAVIFHYDGKTVTPLEKIESGQALSAKSQKNLFQEIAQQAANSREVQAVERVSEIDSSGNGAPIYPSLIATPITRSDQIHEVLCIAFAEEQHFESRDYNTLSLLAIQAAGHLENAALHERIRQGSNRLRAILDSTRDGVILLDYRGRLIEVNPAAQRLLGINLNDHIDESFVDTLLHHLESDEDQQAGYSREELKTLARIQRLEPEGITRREFARQTAPNTITYVEEIGSTVLDENDHMMGRLLVLRDITEEKMVEIYRDEITGMAVHDLRSPLAAIISAQKIAQDNLARPDGKEAIRQALNASLTSADKLMTLVNSLLDIRKGKEMTLERGAASIGELIDSAWQTLQPTAQKHNIPAEFIIPDDLPDVNVDADKMRRVLINLVDNGLRYTPAGKPIQISVQPMPKQRGKLLVRIADSGPGIPAKAREKIFEQYWQVKENRPLRGSKGSGIGLTFCQKVLEAHGERIWVENESPLPGACFAFTLPIC
ncbi:MAG: GAF domain-containing protein [Anaerolineae bacterium]|nr:GAF domain-containing protein [Anaerolineae bacterium]